MRPVADSGAVVRETISFLALASEFGTSVSAAASVITALGVAYAAGTLVNGLPMDICRQIEPSACGRLRMPVYGSTMPGARANVDWAHGRGT
jgi:hypothetical protein